MPTKLKGKPAESQPEGLFTKLMGSGHQLFLAGLGAAARIINEGPKLFETLAQEGAALRERGREQTVHPIRKNEEAPFYSWDKMEELFDEQVARTLNRLGMASQKDVQKLHDQLDGLDKEIAKLLTARAPKPRVRSSGAKKASGQPHSVSPPQSETESSKSSDRPPGDAG